MTATPIRNCERVVMGQRGADGPPEPQRAVRRAARRFQQRGGWALLVLVACFACSSGGGGNPGLPPVAMPAPGPSQPPPGQPPSPGPSQPPPGPSRFLGTAGVELGGTPEAQLGTTLDGIYREESGEPRWSWTSQIRGTSAAQIVRFVDGLGGDDNYPIFNNFLVAPVVRLRRGMSEEAQALARQAVRNINQGMPTTRQLTISDTPFGTPDIRVDIFDEASAVPAGFINLTIVPGEVSPGYMCTDTSCTPGISVAPFEYGGGHLRGVARASTTLGARTGTGVATETIIVHEMLHTLGLRHHILSDFRIGTVMNLVPEANPSAYSPRAPVLYDGTALPDIDRDALYARYTRLEGAPFDGTRDGIDTGGELLRRLGPWDEERTVAQLVGDLPNIRFGAQRVPVPLRDGHAEIIRADLGAWASGVEPSRTLRENLGAVGSATWRGALGGFTGTQADALRSVTGDASLRVDLAALTGDLDFTGLRSWQGRPHNGAGEIFLDGDLSYETRIEGNTLLKTGGDDGDLNAGFFGTNHDAAGGTLERTDLSAGFGMERSN